MSWLDRMYVAYLAIGSIVFIVAALTEPDPIRILSAILFPVWLFAVVMRMRAQRHEA